MKNLSTPYRRCPADRKCYYQNGESTFFNSPHQQNLFLRHCGMNNESLLSVRLICRTLASPGDWHRRINPGFLTITYIHSGETSMRIENHSFLAEPGDLILLPPGTDYEFGTNKKSVRSGIVIQGKIIPEFLKNLHGKYIFTDRELIGLEPKIERFFQEKNIDDHELAVWSFDLISSLKNDEAKIHIPQTLYKVIQNMQKNLSEPLKLEKLAADSGVSSRTLSRMFIKHFQMPPHKYLIRLRMQRACQMLAWEEFSIKEIAYSVGYPNALNFSTEFKRIVGCPPSRYRIMGNINNPQFDLPDVSSPERDEVI